MSVVRYIHFEKSTSSAEFPSVICLGNFDGVHIGHAKLIEETLKMRKTLSEPVKACALCFDPFPADYFSKSPVHHIMSLEEKLKTFMDMGLDGAYICAFDKIHSYSPEKFISEILLDKCNCKGVICGFNYRFGHRAMGTPDDLRAAFSNFKKVEPVMIKWQTVSSTAIKEKIENGDIEGANEMLGRPHYIIHSVTHGKKLGTKLGFPTVNYVFDKADLIPSFGIYVTATEIEGRQYMSVTNVGTRPTIENDGDFVTCETHIIDPDDSFDIYGQKVKVSFFKKTRNEQKFSSLEELSKAIANDVETAKKYFVSLK